MTPLLALILGEVAKQAPTLAIDLIEVIHGGGTPEQWAALRAKWDKPAGTFYQSPPPPTGAV